MSEPLHARRCIVCGLTDTDPKHIIDLGDRSVVFHMDCHAASEPPCVLCAGQIEGARGVTGGLLREHLLRVGGVSGGRVSAG